MSRREVGGLTRQDYAALAGFRYELRRFLAFSERAAASEGLPVQQHQALLAIAGHLGDQPPSVGQVAERLMIAPTTAAELTARMVEAGLVRKQQSASDRRSMELILTEQAQAALERLTQAHLHELRELEPALAVALGRLSGRSEQG